MRNHHPTCSHSSFIKLTSKVSICKDCSVLSFSSSKNECLLFTKPPIFNKKYEENPLKIFDTIYNTIDTSKKEFSELYRSYRPKLLSYIKKQCISYKLSTKTYYLSIIYLDILSQKINNNNIYLLEIYATCCFILAMKFIEIDPPCPDYTSFKGIEDKNTISSRDLFKYEIIIVKQLDYHLDIVTAYDVLGILFMCGIISEEEEEGKPKEFVRNVYNYAKKIVDRAIDSDEISEHYNSIQIAFSAVYIARRVYGLDIKYRKYLKYIFEVEFSYYAQSVRDISSLDHKTKASSNTEVSLSNKIKSIKTMRNTVFVDEPDEKVNQSYKSPLLNNIWKPLVLPYIKENRKNNEPLQTEPNRILFHKPSNSSNEITHCLKQSLTNKLKLSKFITTKPRGEARSSTNLRNVLREKDYKMSMFKLPKI